MGNQYRDQDNKPVRGGLDDVTYCMIAGQILLDLDGKRLQSDDAPVYLQFDIGDGKVVQILNSGYRQKPAEPK
jgi:hypothetical protein